MRIGRTIQGKAGGLFSAAAYNGFDFSGMLIHHNHRSLWLRRNGDALRDGIAFLNVQGCLIFGNCLIGFFR